LSQVVKDAHIAEARGMFPIVSHPVIGDMHVNGTAIKLMETMPHVTRPAPVLGQDNEKIFGEFLGLTKEEITGLSERGIV
jgi:crotonobetainyl-CoA:carnitine CoA-transferase CaiB-like acyl-CoA transferase